MFSLNDDEEAIAVPGRLAYASVSPFVTVLIDEHGNLLRTTSEVTRAPDATDGDVQHIEPLNRGSAHAAEVAFGAPMIEPHVEDRERPERFTEDYVRSLMRHTVNGRDGKPLSGSGGSGRKLPKKTVAILAALPQDITEPEYAPRIRIAGLSPGEREFYLRRSSNTARSVLRELVGTIINDNGFLEPRTKVTRLSFAFEVFGLSEPELTILRCYRNAVRIALATYAHRECKPHTDRLLVEERRLAAEALRTA